MTKKLHLGCGEKYLKGYINIDYPKSKHSIQKRSVADQLIDIKQLKYSPGTIDEIRLHHVFEHFPRATACALLAAWNIWLKDGGILRIEVPDLEKMAQNITHRFVSKRRKMVAERHIFGSQEAPWATHFAGYTPKRITDFLDKYGFKVIRIKNNNWKGTANIDVFAIKNSKAISPNNFKNITRKYLSQFLLDTSGSEKELLEVWMGEYQNQLEKGIK
jgi:predicted SAM-dependent methyltransferase